MIFVLRTDDLARLSPLTDVTPHELSVSECSNQAQSTQDIKSSSISEGITYAFNVVAARSLHSCRHSFHSILALRDDLSHTLPCGISEIDGGRQELKRV